VTVVGIDDTDSREGMCTTYVASRVADSLGAVRTLLVRLNPAVEHKTRGNASLAVHTDASPGRARRVARAAVEEHAEDADTGVVVAPDDSGAVPERVAAFARHAVRDHHDPADARTLAADAGYTTERWGNGRGVVGALAAVGAWRAFDEWTYERIAYREPERWGTPRDFDPDSVFGAAAAAYPAAWDTVDREAGAVVCAPHTPCPVLYGIRGDDPAAVERVAAGVDAEPVAAARTFQTNQGTDAHLREAPLADVAGGRAYRTEGVVESPPESRRGGHVFFTLRAPEGAATVDCAAFEPTKRFRERVRALRPGDRLTVCGEVSDGTLKLEKFAVRELVTAEDRTPDCPDCGRSMESAGAGQGYRCRDCGTAAPGKETVPVDRDIDTGWYEVPPSARRHVAKPLVRGGFDAPTHPER
jgi:tRNA(Ile2)-agmatinylcytidine synthase